MSEEDDFSYIVFDDLDEEFEELEDILPPDTLERLNRLTAKEIGEGNV